MADFTAEQIANAKLAVIFASLKAGSEHALEMLMEVALETGGKKLARDLFIYHCAKLLTFDGIPVFLVVDQLGRTADEFLERVMRK